MENVLASDSGIWVGAGVCKSISDVQKVLKNPDIEGIVFGSITLEERSGNPGTTFFPGDHYTLNSIGLSNHGLQKYLVELPEIIKLVHAAGKKIIISIAADDAEGYEKLAVGVAGTDADGLEVNLGCPNKWDKGGIQSEIASFNSELIASALTAISGVLSEYRPGILGVKLSPYTNPVELTKRAKMINMFPHVRYVASSNTIANAYTEYGPGGVSVITKHQGNPKGFAGLAGDALFPVAIGNVMQFRQVLRDDISIMGVGGISSGQQMFSFLRNGADAVQIVSAYYKNYDPYVFSKIYAEYMELEEQSDLLNK